MSQPRNAQTVIRTRPRPPQEKKMALDLDAPTSRASMDSVVVQKDKLVETLTENRDKHQAIFDEAMEGYEARSIELLNEHIARIKSGTRERIIVSLPVPENHTDDYDRALTSLEWSIFDEVELTMREFDMYVRDNWAWKQEFVGTTSLYNNGGH